MVRIERELTHLVRRAQRVQLHTDGPVEPLERSAYTILGFLNDEGKAVAWQNMALFVINVIGVYRYLIRKKPVHPEPKPA